MIKIFKRNSNVFFKIFLVIMVWAWASSGLAQSMKKGDAFRQHVPNPKDLMWQRGEDLDRILTKMGFDGDYKYADGVYFGPYQEFGDYFYYIPDTNDDRKILKSILISFLYEEDGGYSYTLEVRIEGDEKALDRYYQKALKLREKGPSWYTDVKKDGQKIIITSGGD